jgi:NTP pyrophosphatase (non-canonical NTP hydrolase)
VATKARIDLDDLVWHYFPFVCPTCWQPVCVCGVEKKVAKLAAQKDEVTLAAMRTKNAARQPRVLDDYVQMFSAIYGSHSDSATLVDIYLHFSEEVGEVAHHIREVEAASGAGGNPAGVIELALRSELADVFSWVCKLCWRIDRNLQGFLPWAQYHLPITTADLFQIRFSEIIYHEYEMGCPSCHSRPCLIDCRSWHERQGADSSGKLGTKE